ncbi:hypothetical protein HA45_22385 [Pantoea rodasii]|uniref:amino acid permease n=1 Tax=Pantoea rodasii TaxID=1076549 RepID=UPI000A25704C|nr:amino acid permease [Pantoea rodasii]ORM59851.1 hypothetical protein HA45_22385 [Pantoea rodasii]
MKDGGEGGIFTWVSNNLGERWGFAAISFTYLQIAIGFIPMLYFIVGAVSDISGISEINTNPLMKTAISLLILWSLALTQLGGLKNTQKIAKCGFFLGIVLPVLLLWFSAFWYFYHGGHRMIDLKLDGLMPHLSDKGGLEVFVAFILSYMGIEASATHANEMYNSRKNYPLAILILMICTILFSSVSGLIIALVMPNSEISLSSGLVQALSKITSHVTHDAVWAVKIFSALLVFGVMGEISAWITGPSKGLLVTAKQGLLPVSFSGVNKNGVPVKLVMLQLLITSIAIVLFTNISSSSNSAFLIALSLTVLIYLCAYFMLFVSYIKMVITKKKTTSGFVIPGGKACRLLVAAVGFITSLFAFVVSFIPPESVIGHMQRKDYLFELLISFLIVISIPFIVCKTRRKK